MNWERLWAVLQSAVMIAGGILLFSLRQAFKAGSDLRDFENRLMSVERRMDDAGDKMSKFATEVQGLPERFRSIFVTDQQHRDLKEDVRHLRELLDRRTDDSPWPNNRRRRQNGE